MAIERRIEEKLRRNDKGSFARCNCHVIYGLIFDKPFLLFSQTYIPWRYSIWWSNWKTMQASLKGLERTDEREAFSGGVDCVLEMMFKGMVLTREGRRECDWHWRSPFRLGKEVVVGMEWEKTEKTEKTEKKLILHWWSLAWRWMIACRWSYHGYRPTRHRDCSLYIQSNHST